MLRLCVLSIAAACGRVNFANLSDAGVASDAAPCTEPWGPAVELVYGYVEPSVTPDELELYLVRGGELFVMSRVSRTMPWSAPQLLPIPPNTDYSDNTPSISGDGLTLYFSSYQMGNAFVEVSRRATRDGAWSLPTDSGVFGNPEIRDDELEIVIQDYMSPIQRATRASVTDGFSALTPVEAIINDGSTNASPGLSSDGLELYFWSNRTGTPALYVARRSSLTAPFTTVEPLGIERPGAGGLAADVSSDGHHLYFSMFATGDYATYVSSRCE